MSTKGSKQGAKSAQNGPLAVDMRVNVAGIALKNPILAAAGTFGYGVEFEDIVSLEKLGGFVVKGLSREPMAGNLRRACLRRRRAC